MTQTVAVVTDSAASLPPELARKWGVRVVPMQVIVGGEAHAEGDDITPEQVLAHLVIGETVTTSQPNAAAFEREFAAAEREGAGAIVAVLISSQLSGTVSVAQAAAGSVGIPVHVVDSATVAMATGYAALAAAALAATGADALSVAEAARSVARSSLCMFTVDDLDHLRKGGRIGPAVAAVGRVLGVRPLLTVTDGAVAMHERVRTTERSRAALVEHARRAILACERPGVAVMALGAAKYATAAMDTLRNECPQLVFAVATPVSAVLAAHAGPGALAIVVADLPEQFA